MVKIKAKLKRGGEVRTFEMTGPVFENEEAARKQFATTHGSYDVIAVEGFDTVVTDATTDAVPAESKPVEKRRGTP